MASGIHKIHQPGTCNESEAAHCSSTEECNQELHVKMCKKIAQLTKVNPAAQRGGWAEDGGGCMLLGNVIL